FILRSQSKCNVREARRNQRKLVGDRTHRLNFEGTIFELLPVTTLHFTAAGEDERLIESRALARTGGLPVVEHARVNRSEERFFCSGVVDSSGHGLAVLGEADRDTELGDALNEFPRAIERIDDPDPLFVETRGI